MSKDPFADLGFEPAQANTDPFASLGFQQEETPEPGFVQGTVQSIVKPALMMAGSVRDITRDVKQIPQILKGAQFKESPNQTEYDYGYLGKAKSLGKATPDKEGAKSMLRGAAAGLGLASNIPMAKSVGTAAQLLKAGTLRKVLGSMTGKLAVEGAAGGGMYGLSDSVLEDQSLADTVKNTVINAGIGAVAAPVIGKGAEYLGRGVGKAIQMSTKEGRDASVIAAREKDIFDIENNYSKTRKAIDQSKDANAGSRSRVAHTDVLVDSVDNTGTIRTTQKGGAVEKYRADYVDGNESVVRDLLVKEGRMVDLPTIRKELTREIRNSGLEEDALVAALNKVNKKLAGLALRGKNGMIPLEAIQDAKLFTYKNIDYTKPTSKLEAKAVARAYKGLIEKNSSHDIGTINKELQKYYQDLDLLENLDGKKVEGGRLGKHFAQVAGNVVGAAVGSVGGPVGAGIGGLVGGAVSKKIAGKVMSNTFGRAVGKTIPKSEVLQKAVSASKAPRLALPAPKSPIRSEVRNTKVISLPKKTQSRADQEAIAKFGIKQTQGNNMSPSRFKKANTTKTTTKPNPIPKTPIQKSKEAAAKKRIIPNSTKNNASDTIQNKAPIKKDLTRSIPGSVPQKSAKVQLPKENYKETGNITTKLLTKLEGKSFVSKQFISDLTNSGDMKQVEKDLIRKALELEGDKVDVALFAKKIQSELLPLDRTMVGSNYKGASPHTDTRARYESVTLPEQLRGEVKNYSEHVYQSPIKTSAGSKHFSSNSTPKNYFGHTRTEDMADGSTRRVIEVQSDLYQKGGLERESPNSKVFKKGSGQMSESMNAKYNEVEKDYNKLQQYNDPTAHFRMVREEVKKAAEDGITKLQFPTGETAMKIEGLGETATWDDVSRINKIRAEGRATGRNSAEILEEARLKPDELHVGQEVKQVGSGEWIITDVLGDGKFRAVTKREDDLAKTHLKEGSMDAEDIKAMLDDASEAFDISGKIDTNNPIYKFYEKDLGRYLTNNYGAKIVEDGKGVKWFEIPIKKEQAKLPVQAFGMAPMGLISLYDKIKSLGKETYTREEEPAPEEKPINIVGNVDIKDYATDPNHEKMITQIYATTSKLKTLEEINEHIERVTEKKSPVDGRIFLKIAKETGVDLGVILALAQGDTMFGTKGLGARLKNIGNWGNDDTGRTVRFKTWEDGLRKVAEWAKKHEVKP